MCHWDTRSIKKNSLKVAKRGTITASVACIFAKELCNVNVLFTLAKYVCKNVSNI
jgi:hypothetical protein